jgi:hypothetical protein
MRPRENIKYLFLFNNPGILLCPFCAAESFRIGGIDLWWLPIFRKVSSTQVRSLNRASHEWLDRLIQKQATDVMPRTLRQAPGNLRQFTY